MKSVLASIVAVAGMTVAANAVVNTNVVFQVSLDGTNWSSSVDITGAGATVYTRTLVSYIPGSNGTSVPLGLASFVFQPTVSNWNGATDTLGGFVNGGMGGNTSSPLGVVTPAQAGDTANFGRLSPFGRTSLSSTSFLKGFVHANPNGDGVNYLRIAQAQVTGWIGGAGNTTGGSGVPISQLNDVGRTTADPAFSSSLSNVLVFKAALTIGAGHNDTLVINAPLDGFGNRNSATGDREVYWFAGMTESTGSLRGTANVTGAQIRIPAPGAAALLGLGGLVVSRRRRQA